MSLRLSTYSTVSEEDRYNIRTILLTISELLFTQSARSSVFASSQRRRLALSSLGLTRHAESASVQSLPIRGPFLFDDHILDAVDKEI